jgi:hypothetical protein
LVQGPVSSVVRTSVIFMKIEVRAFEEARCLGRDECLAIRAQARRISRAQKIAASVQRREAALS